MGHHITDHAHPHHEGPHHDMYIHESNRNASYVKAKKPMGHYEGHLEKQDTAGHEAKMVGSARGCK